MYYNKDGPEGSAVVSLNIYNKDMTDYHLPTAPSVTRAQRAEFPARR